MARSKINLPELNIYILLKRISDFRRSSTLFGTVNDDISVGDYVESNEGDIDKNKLRRTWGLVMA